MHLEFSKNSKLVGSKVGYLTVIARIKSSRKCLVRCICGETKMVDERNLARIRSCGCQRSAAIRSARTTHGGRFLPEYKVWAGMLQRCENPNNQKFPLYGGREIKVCKRWHGPKGFANFLRDMGPRPTDRTASNHPQFSIDRIKVNGNYTRLNCRWADASTQRRNQRRVQLKNAA